MSVKPEERYYVYVGIKDGTVRARAMTELENAVALANRALGRPNADPDDDLAVLARQFLRAHERLAELERFRRAHPGTWEHWRAGCENRRQNARALDEGTKK